jgi:hypothetical protein
MTKRILSAAATLSVLAVGSLASAAPRSGMNARRPAPAVSVHSAPRVTYARPVARVYPRPVPPRPARFDYTRAHARARLFAHTTSGILARARAARHLSAYQRVWVQRLHDLSLLSQRFMAWDSSVSLAYKWAELARMEAELAAIQANAPWLSGYGDLAALANSVAELRAMLTATSAPQQHYAMDTYSY